MMNPCLASGRALDEAADDAADPELVALRRRHHVQLSLLESKNKVRDIDTPNLMKVGQRALF